MPIPVLKKRLQEAAKRKSGAPIRSSQSSAKDPPRQKNEILVIRPYL